MKYEFQIKKYKFQNMKYELKITKYKFRKSNF